MHLIFLLLDGSEMTKLHSEYIKKLSKFAPIIPILSKGDLLDPAGVNITKDILMRTARNEAIQFFDVKEVIEI